jgi:hypothetical protein
LRHVLSTLAIVFASLLCGVAVWFAAAWVLSLIADHTSSDAVEIALAAISPLAFGPLVALVAAIIVFFFAWRHARSS